MGYATGQFGKNHLGDLNQFLPTVHGFDEFYGYLYHLDAMEDPSHPNYPPEVKDKVGPRTMIHSWATDRDDPTEQPRWGKVGKQKIEDAGTLYPKRMETVDDEILDLAMKFVDKAKAESKPFFCWLNPTRMHVVTHLSDKYEKTRTPQNGWSIHEAGMAQLDDIVGSVLKKLKDDGLDGNTIVVFTTDNGTENFTWPDGGQTPFAGGKGTVMEGGFRAPCIARWPGKIPADKVENGIFSEPRLVSDAYRNAAGDSKIVEELKSGKKLENTTFKVHLDGYDQTDLITGKGPWQRLRDLPISRRARLARVLPSTTEVPLHPISQKGWRLRSTVKVDWPILVNLRLDPFERTGMAGSLNYYSWFAYEFWRFVYVQQEVGKLAQTAIEFPPMQKGASFNLPGRHERNRSKKAAQARCTFTGEGSRRARRSRSVHCSPTIENALDSPADGTSRFLDSERRRVATDHGSGREHDSPGAHPHGIEQSWHVDQSGIPTSWRHAE